MTRNPRSASGASAAAGEGRLPPLPARFRLPPELRLLIAASWLPAENLQAAQAGQIERLIADGIDWAAFLVLVDRHRVPALVHAVLAGQAAGRLPEEVRAQLAERSDRARVEALRLAAETVRLVDVFAAAGIAVLVLKGAVLSQQLYGDPALRQSKDIDLLVRPAELERADRLLQEQGWRRSPAGGLTPRQQRFVVTAWQHFEYVHAKTGMLLELHWQLDLWTPAQVAGLWDERQPLALGGGRIDTLDGPLRLLYLCSHGAGHKWFRLKWLSDVAMLLARDRPDGWDDLPALADRLGLRRPLAQGALLAHWLYGVALPAPLRALAGSDRELLPLCHAALRDLLMPEEAYARRGARLDNLRSIPYFLRIRPGLPLRRYLLSLAIAPADFQEVRLPDSLFWLYAPLRPALWAWRNFLKRGSR